MLPYIFFWSVFAVRGLLKSRKISFASSFALLVFLTLQIGLRHRVGGDWFAYTRFLEAADGISLFEALQSAEPGYTLFNWLANLWGYDVYLVNSFCALIFSIGLMCFCRAQPRPWLALTLAFPYLVLVVGMGYSRQGVAIGFELLGLLALERGRLLQFLAWIALASTFHRTALVLLVLPAASISPSLRFGQLIRLVLLAGAGYGLYNAFLAEDLSYYHSGYIDAGYQSQGALIRVLLCLLPALLFLLKRRRFHLPQEAQRLWTLISLLAVASAIGLATVASSTAVDRLALYLIPLQLFVGSRIPDARLFGISPTLWSWLLVLFSLAVLLVWLLFATNSRSWLPYRNLLLPL